VSFNDFEVGSIVYFLHSKTETVLPAKVVEKIVRTSLLSTKSTYVVAVAAKSKLTNIELDPEVVSTFQTLEEMREHMLAKAELAIDSLLSAAEKASHHLESKATDPGRPEDESRDYAIVDLGDGKKARMKL
jgi:hypothetical protein